MKKILAVTGVMLTSVLVPLPAQAAQAAPKKPARAYDFNGDGRRDAVVVSTYGYAKGQLSPGVLAVLYGGTGKKQVYGAEHPGLFGLPDRAWSPQETVSADFDRDGYADAAVAGGGTPSEAGPGIVVIYGSKKGLSSRTAFLPTPRLPVEAWAGRARLAAGDFDGDGRTDLVHALTDSYLDGFHVSFLPAIGRGTNSTAHRLPIGAPGSAARLAAGDFTGDGRSDLAITTLLDDEAGPVLLLKGSPTGPGAAVPVPGSGAWYDVAAGDVTGDGRADLVVGVRTRGLGTIRIHPGRSGGLGTSVSFTKQTRGIPGSTKPNLGDEFGSSIALADLNRDGRADLAIGDPSDGNFNRGSVTIVYGAKKGYTTKGARVFTEDSRGVPTASRSSERFGSDVALLDLTGDRAPDLLVGAIGESRVFLFRTVKGRVSTPVKSYTAAGMSVVRSGNGFDFGNFGR